MAELTVQSGSSQMEAGQGMKAWVSRAKAVRVAHGGTLRKSLRVPFSFVLGLSVNRLQHHGDAASGRGYLAPNTQAEAQ